MAGTQSPDLTTTIRAVHGALSGATQPPIATYAVTTAMVENLASTVEVRHHRIPVGQTAPLGVDEGPSPVDLLLGALGTCQEVVLGVHARLLGIELESVKVEVEGDLDPRGFFGVAEVPVGLSEVRYTVYLKSSADPNQLAELISRAERLCPVSAIIAEPTPLVPSYVVNGTPYASASA